MLIGPNITDWALHARLPVLIAACGIPVIGLIASFAQIMGYVAVPIAIAYAVREAIGMSGNKPNFFQMWGCGFPIFLVICYIIFYYADPTSSNSNSLQLVGMVLAVPYLIVLGVAWLFSK
jgi:hypothetical protein